ncbi:peptidyl-prolyl cis-trans isomerase [Aureococcus anophagefferens]|nr:peptidyl-prolyl cis-trans isomerase [Aureococcus anophagefferens]
MDRFPGGRRGRVRYRDFVKAVAPASRRGSDREAKRSRDRRGKRPNYARAFEVYDYAGDGTVSRSDFDRAFTALGFELSSSDARRVADRFDRDGAVAWRDLARYADGDGDGDDDDDDARSSGSGASSAARDDGLSPDDIFAHFDLDGDGTIDEREFAKAMKKLGVSLSSREVRKTMAQFPAARGPPQAEARKVQQAVEAIKDDLRAKRIRAAGSDVVKAQTLLGDGSKIAAGARARQGEERDSLDKAFAAQATAADLVSKVEARLVPAGLKYANAPPEFKNVPRLDGRARRGFYNGMAIQRADGFVVQTGDPDGPDGPLIGYGQDGDPKKEPRRVPLELFVDGDKAPTYGETTEDGQRGSAQTVLPFQAYGALGMARDEYEADSASSQFFFLLFDSDLTPAGKNLLDGRYSCFGYTIAGSDFLGAVEEGDIIKSVKILKAPPPFGDYKGSTRGAGIKSAVESRSRAASRYARV